MVFADFIKYKTFVKEVDSDGLMDETESWVDLGKCTIFPNTAAKKQIGNDTEQRIYSYEIMMRIPKLAIPKEGEWVRITKKDGTIDEELEVIGFMTIKGRFLKLWV